MPIDFQPLDPLKPVRIYRRNLPHWRQDGATYFVTFRLFDSLPAPMLKQLGRLRKLLLDSNEQENSYLGADRAYFQQYKAYLDRGHGCCWLRDSRAKDLAANALTFFDGHRYQLGETAVMPNHVHALVRPLAGFELAEILHSWKSYTAKRILDVVGGGCRVWQDEAYDRLVRDRTELGRMERYIKKNRDSLRGHGRDARATGAT